jgi:hypothetical protein
MEGTQSYLKFLTDICITLLSGNPQYSGSDDAQTTPKKKMKAADVPESVRYDKIKSLANSNGYTKCAEMEGCKRKKCLVAPNAKFTYASTRALAF